MPPSLAVANSYELGLDKTRIKKLGRYHRKIEGKWNNFWSVVFDMGWHERIWVGIYNGVEVQEMKMMN